MTLRRPLASRTSQRALTSAPYKHKYIHTFTLCVCCCGARRTGSPLCGSPCAGRSRFAPQSIKRAAGEACVLQLREKCRSRQLGLEVRSWVRSSDTEERGDMRRWRPHRQCTPSHTFSVFCWSPCKSSRPWRRIHREVFVSESSWPCQRRSRSKTMSAEDKKSSHVPNGNGVVRTGKRPFIIGVSGGTASGKVGYAAAVRIRQVLTKILRVSCSRPCARGSWRSWASTMWPTRSARSSALTRIVFTGNWARTRRSRPRKETSILTTLVQKYFFIPFVTPLPFKAIFFNSRCKKLYSKIRAQFFLWLVSAGFSIANLVRRPTGNHVKRGCAHWQRGSHNLAKKLFRTRYTC